MSESVPIYIACATNNNAFVDVMVTQKADLVRVVCPGGYGTMDFTPSDARKLALAILDLIGDDELPKQPQPSAPPLRRARKIGGSFQHTGTLVAEFETTVGEPRVVLEFDAPVKGMLHVYRPDQVVLMETPPAPLFSGDDIVDAVRQQLLERSLAGQQKYGAKMTRDDLGLVDWIRHAQAEALDQAVYLERLKWEAECMEDDRK